MFTERNAIEDELRDITRQIEMFWNRRTELRLRLREIDERDFKKNDIPYDALNSLTDKLTKVIGQLSAIIPPVEVSQVIEHIAKDVNKDQIIKPDESNQSPQNEKLNLIKEEIKKEKSYTPPLEKVSRERTISVIKEILLDNGGPMKAKAIEREFYKRTNGRRFTNFYEQIKFAQKTFPKIRKLDRGTYIYEIPAPPVNEDKQEEKKEDETPILQMV